MNRIKIVHIVDTLDPGGAQEIIANILKYSIAEKYAHYCLALHGPGVVGDELLSADYWVKYLSDTKYNAIRIIHNLVKTIRAIKPNIVNLHLEFSTILGLTLRSSGSKYIVTQHALKEQLPGWYLPILYFLIRRADGVVVEDHICQRDIESLGVPPARISYIPIGTDYAEKLRHINVSQYGIRKEFSIPGEAPIILNVARLHPRKGQALLLQAFAQVVTRFPQARCVIVGDGPERERLFSTADKLGVAGAVIFPGTRRDLENFYADADIFVMPAIDEAMGVVVYQAMAFGVPVIASDVGSIREVISHQETGYLIPPGDAVALAKKIMEILPDIEVHKKTVGRAGAELVETTFSAQTMVQRYERFYERVLEQT